MNQKNQKNGTDPQIIEESGKILKMQQEVLTAVSFNQPLFEKELEKAERWLLSDDFKKLIDWVLDNFSSTFNDLKERIKSLFSTHPAVLV